MQFLAAWARWSWALQSPKLEVTEMFQEFLPSQIIWLCITAIFVDPLSNIRGILAREKPLLVRLVREVDNNEPRNDRDDYGQEAFDDL